MRREALSLRTEWPSSSNEARTAKCCPFYEFEFRFDSEGSISIDGACLAGDDRNIERDEIGQRRWRGSITTWTMSTSRLITT